MPKKRVISRVRRAPMLVASALLFATLLLTQADRVRTPLAPGSPAQSQSPSGAVPTPPGPNPTFETKSVSMTSFNGSLRDLRVVASAHRPTEGIEEERAPQVHAGRALPLRSSGSSSAPTPSLSFDGVSYANGDGTPPDPHGDVGLNHYIEAVNTSIGIYSKSTGALSIPIFSFNSFMTTGGVTGSCASLNMGDPYVLFDRMSNRWIITDFAFGIDGSGNDVGPYYECIAVSKTSDPVNGGWYFYQLKVGDSIMGDYPKFSVWADGMYMTVNLFYGSSYYGVEVVAFNRADLIAGVATPRIQGVQLDTGHWSILPVNDESGTATGPAPFISDDDGLRIWKLTIDWSDSGNSVWSAPVYVSGVSAYSDPTSDVTQKGSNIKLDSLGGRLMSAAKWSNASGTPAIWIARTYDAGKDGTGIYWAEVRGLSATPTVYQQMLYSSSTASKWIPSLAVDKVGNMALLYSYAGKNNFPSLAYAARTSTATLGTLNLGERSLAEGQSAATSQWARWGDYFAASIDPVNDCTVWMVGEYMSALQGANWNTRIVKTIIPGCIQAPVNAGVPTTPTAPEINVLISANPGTWSESPTFTYAWYSCTNSGAAASGVPNDCSSISSANSVDYTPSARVAGMRLRVKVTATSDGGSGSFVSAATDPVLSDPTNSTAPSISGTAKGGNTLTAATGTWKGYPAISYTYLWLRCASSDSSTRTGTVAGLPGTCAEIATNGTAQTYIPVLEDIGTYLRVGVTATNTRTSVTYFSKTTSLITGGAPVNTIAPTLSGSALVNGSLVAAPGTWNGVPTPSGTYTYTWYKCTKAITASASSTSSCSKINGATGPTFSVTSIYKGKYLRVQVTATSAGGSTSYYSATTARVS